jgi:hypothetical protein
MVGIETRAENECIENDNKENQTGKGCRTVTKSTCKTTYSESEDDGFYSRTSGNGPRSAEVCAKITDTKWTTARQ